MPCSPKTARMKVERLERVAKMSVTGGVDIFGGRKLHVMEEAGCFTYFYGDSIVEKRFALQLVETFGSEGR